MIRHPCQLEIPPHLAPALQAGLRRNMLQQADELILLTSWMEDHGLPLTRVLEIGQHDGGSTAFFATLATSLVLSVDKPDGIGGGLPLQAARERNWSLVTEFPHYCGVLGDSHLPSTLADVMLCLDGVQVDLLFIDGDHSFAGVTADYDDYRQFVRSGGVIAFHDILDTATNRAQGIDVAGFWRTLPDPKWVFSIDGAWGGIGAIRRC